MLLAFILLYIGGFVRSQNFSQSVKARKFESSYNLIKILAPFVMFSVSFCFVIQCKLGEHILFNQIDFITKSEISKYIKFSLLIIFSISIGGNYKIQIKIQRRQTV